MRSSAAAWRAQFSLPVVGVAGSNGKTTVKEMVAAILERRGATLATRGNLNNHIGVPLTLHRLDAAHRHAVVEIGAPDLDATAKWTARVGETCIATGCRGCSLAATACRTRQAVLL